MPPLNIYIYIYFFFFFFYILRRCAPRRVGCISAIVALEHLFRIISLLHWAIGFGSFFTLGHLFLGHFALGYLFFGSFVLGHLFSGHLYWATCFGSFLGLGRLFRVIWGVFWGARVLGHRVGHRDSNRRGRPSSAWGVFFLTIHSLAPLRGIHFFFCNS